MRRDGGTGWTRRRLTARLLEAVAVTGAMMAVIAAVSAVAGLLARALGAA